MKYGRVFLMVASVLWTTSAFASCPTAAGPFFFGSTIAWYTYDFDTSCGSTSGNVSSTNMWCYSKPANQWDSGSVDYTMTVPANAYPNFQVSVFVEFNDPHAEPSNAVSASVLCWHNNSLTHSETIFIHAGDQGSLNCVRLSSSVFTASAGDTITVSMGGQNYDSDTTMQISTPTIFSLSQ